ncbi:hypothetical protein K488DRAFT_74972 [Vararia minispora EC-137]|uniref:Uncharacterized protein n=1 Tax=Vararia minispora EC-137 TaxID=1314806 RepID=A0ACB8Q5N2_9AGAM|nr:hypothetical protein K488DRAFT_74972 [Vararia minispora EC-137]
MDFSIVDFPFVAVEWANPLGDDLMLDQPQHPIYYPNGPTPIQGQELDGLAPEVIQQPAGQIQQPADQIQQPAEQIPQPAPAPPEDGLLVCVFGSEDARNLIVAFFHPGPVPPDIRFEDAHGDERRPRYTVPVTIPLEVAGALAPAEGQNQAVLIDVSNEPSAVGIPYEQVMFMPGGGPGNASYTRHALNARLLPTVFFEDMDGRLGVSLNVALGPQGELASVLRDALMPARIGEGTTKHIHVRRRGYKEHGLQIRLDGGRPRSHMDFLRCNASAVESSFLPQENLRLQDIKVLCSVNKFSKRLLLRHFLVRYW